MKKRILAAEIGLLVLLTLVGYIGRVEAKDKIHALYLPLADHYAAAVVAKAKYGDKMEKCDYSVEMMKSVPSLRGKFMAGQADVAYFVAPIALDMFSEKPFFRCVSLVHRDGNALAVNDIFAKRLNLPAERKDRKPTPDLANEMAKWKKETGKASSCAIPSPIGTHVIVLYKYLKENGKTLSIEQGDGDVIAKVVAPPQSAEFLQLEAKGGRAASFEQSLPWADIVETEGQGKVVWYSKDVMKWPLGHVECIMIATDDAIKNKREALKELIYYIHKAGRDIEEARTKGGPALEEIATLVNKAIPAHTVKAVSQSLQKDIDAINYSNLNVDIAGTKMIMDLALEGGILKKAVDITAFHDESFKTELH
ncbi:MAG: ABC transporter substrate-binding protein [Deltaproteobacteria bacterium]|nr:ABC transporter substrate-binding protein [Deltaproteobacteria bacterium]